MTWGMEAPMTPVLIMLCLVTSGARPVVRMMVSMWMMAAVEVILRMALLMAHLLFVVPKMRGMPDRHFFLRS